LVPTKSVASDNLAENLCNSFCAHVVAAEDHSTELLKTAALILLETIPQAEPARLQALWVGDSPQFTARLQRNKACIWNPTTTIQPLEDDA
jgi:hypothetical protein